MTTETMDLQALLEKTTDTDFLRHMIGFSAQRLMELEVEGLTGAAPGARTPDRLNHRNGYRDRDWETRTGTVDPHSEAAQRKHSAFRSRGGWPRRHSRRDPGSRYQALHPLHMTCASHGDGGIPARHPPCAEIDESARLPRPPAGDWLMSG
jgi:hypothetical protein